MPFRNRNSILRKLEELFLQLSNLEHLWLPHRKAAIEFLDIEFPEYNRASQTAFDELTSLVDTQPQVVIDLLRETMSTETLTTFSLLGHANKPKLRAEIDLIATFWELSCLFRIPAYLFSQRHVPIQTLCESKAVFKNFRMFGIKSKDVELMRQIRNARFHRLGIKKGKLIGRDDSGAIIIGKAEISRLSAKLQNLFQWYFRFVLGQTLYIPKFGILLIYTLFEKVYRYPDDLKADLEEIKTGLLPEADFKLSKNEAWKDRLQTIGQKIKTKVSAPLRKYKVSKFLYKNQALLIDKAKHHSKDVVLTLRNLSDQLTSVSDKKNFLLLSEYVIAFGRVMDELER